MKLRLSDLSLLIVLYCTSLFVMFQPVLLAIIGDGSTTLVNMGMLSLMVVLFILQASQNKRFAINPRYLVTYAFFALGLLINYLAFSEQIQFPQKYFAAFFFVTISALISCKTFVDRARLPNWIGLPVALYFIGLTLQQSIATDFGNAGRVSLNDEVLSNINYMPIAAFILTAYFYAAGKRMPMLVGAATVILLLILTQSRSAFLGVIVAVLILRLKKARLNLKTLLYLLGLLTVAWIVFFGSGLNERFFTDIENDLINRSGRFLLLFDIYERFLASPFFGAGFAVDDHIRFDPHNIFLELVLQGGLIGMVTMTPIIILGAWTAFSICGHSQLGTFASLGCICLIVAGQFSGSILLNLPLWLFIGLCLSISKKASVSRA